MASLTILLLIAVLVVTGFYWKQIDWYFKILIVLIISCFVPSLSDIRSLFKTYDSYKDEWLNENETHKDNDEHGDI